MQLAFWVRRAHKWIGLIIGVQALLWMISGLYMVVVPLEVIHGDHLAHVHTERLNPAGTRIAQTRLHELYPGITSVRMKSLLGKEVYEIKQGPQASLVDAASGEKISPLAREDIIALADVAYAGEGSIGGVEWVTKAPQEVGSRPVPLWAVHYDEPGKTTLYFSPYTGDLVARRHELWRWFDFLWMFHIMDYEERENVNNTLLRVASISGLAFALSGAWLLIYSFNRRKKA
ncbi:PepSY domain-containing protein [Massilia niastensis]|uniref:PepSY domain-containing protein n=1 Tax=Massilia niastensis TaxID=544911 RepID=UPI00035F902B|nr:PepSY domain-containing protein [Massilia niastensis]